MSLSADTLMVSVPRTDVVCMWFRVCGFSVYLRHFGEKNMKTDRGKRAVVLAIRVHVHGVHVPGMASGQYS
jgi:hypothetical protein